jgi:hypothetical protein
MTFVCSLPLSVARRWSVWALLVAAVFAGPAALRAQEEADPGTSGRRPVVTRAQLQQSLEAAEALANSDAYSASFREAKRDEAALIRERLLEGDFYVGDQISITMIGDSGTTGIKAIGPGRVLTLPGLPDIPMRGVLRSELEAYLTEQVGRYVREPQIKARPTIRLTFMGGVGKAGFYQMDADIMLSDALMQAGGIGNQTELKDSKILRGEDQIMDGEAFNKAVTDGVTLDQLNLRAGDVVEVGIKQPSDWYTTLRTIAVIPALIISTYGIGKLFGIF